MTTGRTLSRDYKHVKRQTPGGQVFNGWVGLAVGLGAGLSVAAGVYLHFSRQPPAEPQPQSATAPASAKAGDEQPMLVDPAKDYTFYDMLPEQEVDVPKPSAASKRPAADVMPKGDVVLQAGAFKQADEADRLKARLAQFGVDAKIQRISVDDETLFRVRIGPIATVQELENVRARLAEADVETMDVSSDASAAPLP